MSQLASQCMHWSRHKVAGAPTFLFRTLHQVLEYRTGKIAVEAVWKRNGGVTAEADRQAQRLSF